MNIPTTRLGLRPRPFIWVLLLGCILAYPLAPAVSSPSGDKRDYILVINTYAESTPWSRGIITDITARVEQIENLELYTEHINLLLVDSPREIETFETNLLREYGKKPPRALVLEPLRRCCAISLTAYGKAFRPSYAQNRILSGRINITRKGFPFRPRNRYLCGHWQTGTI